MQTHHLHQQLTQWAEKNRWRTRQVVTPIHEEPVWIQIQDQRCLDFSSNDYLGLKFNPYIRQAITTGVLEYGNGSGGSNAVSGYHPLQPSLEARFASWLGVEQALLFNSGYLANLGVITSLANRHSLIVSDKLCHRSILDGILLSRARHRRYSHTSIHDLKILCQQEAPDIIITEHVFSMQGNITPIEHVDLIAKTQRATLIIDDAHGLGVLGQQGRGCCDYPNIMGQTSCFIFPLGKAFCSLGAMVAGSSEMMTAILQFANTYRYTTALPPSVVAGLHASLDVILAEPWRRDKLHDNIQYFNQLAQHHGLDLITHDITPIRAIIIPPEQCVLTLQQKLLQAGFYVASIRPPTVPTARLRISLSAQHETAHIKALIQQLTKALA